MPDQSSDRPLQVAEAEHYEVARERQESTIDVPPVPVTIELKKQSRYVTPHIVVRLFAQFVPIGSVSMKNYSRWLVTTPVTFCQ
jgi:hypothetical protein